MRKTQSGLSGKRKAKNRRCTETMGNVMKRNQLSTCPANQKRGVFCALRFALRSFSLAAPLPRCAFALKKSVSISRLIPLSLPKYLVLALMLLGLALRLWFMRVNAIDPRFSTADDGDYYQRALRFALTGVYMDDFWLIRPPLHVFLFAGVLRVSVALGNLPLGVTLIRCVQIVLILLCIPIGYDIARRLFNVRAGLILALLLAIWFPLVELPIHTYSEGLFTFLLLLHLWLLLCWRADRRWPWLAAAGATLGLTALTRSPALYASAFVVLWLLLETLDEQRRRPDAPAQPLGALVRQRVLWCCCVQRSLAFLVALVVVVGPWTIRNYLVYERLILIDTLGPPNLWLDLQPDRRRNVARLQSVPQADRQAFAMAELKQILSADPLRLVQNAWPNFRHIWKAQFVEDYFVKQNFYTRPLREMSLLGFLGDGLWLMFTLVGLMALAAPLWEGAFRWLLLGWLGYTILTVLLLHVEPRYLLPIWLVLMLYAAWAVSDPASMLRMLRQQRWHGALAMLLVTIFVALFISYRDYPGLLARGLQREWHYHAGARAYTQGDYDTAVQALQRMVVADPRSIDGRIDLARTLLAQARYDEALTVLGNSTANRAMLLRAAIARAQGQHEQAARLFRIAGRWRGENIQDLALKWLQPPPTTHLVLGNDQDYGYIQGFSASEQVPQPDGRGLTYRWLLRHGQIVLPLPAPLGNHSLVALRMAGGPIEATPLRLRFESGHQLSFPVTSGAWRVYQILTPSVLAGQAQLRLMLDAPAFIPVLLDMSNNDMRSLSLMISEVQVKPGAPDVP